MKKIAIIAFFHPESSLCLAKYIAKQGYNVDFFYIVDYIRGKRYSAGFEYLKAKRNLGIHKLQYHECPEIIKDTKGLPIRYHLLRLLSFSPKAWFLNKIIIRNCVQAIKKENYDAVNIVGQHPWVEYIHDLLADLNITHTFHEVGSHQNGIMTTPLMNKVIKDKTKVILPSKSTYNRYISIPHAKTELTTIIPMGKFETLLFYERDCNLNIHVDLTKPTFLLYGFIKPYKGLDLLAKAVKVLQKDNIEFNLIIAGGGHDDNLPYFQSLSNCQVINRFISNDEMMKLNRISTAVLLPYKSASQSGIVLTTFMLGKPIIGTKVGALLETIKDEYNGLLVEKDDYEGFALAMKRIIEDKELVQKLSTGAKNFGQDDDYDWNKIAKQTIEFLFFHHSV